MTAGSNLLPAGVLAALATPLDGMGRLDHEGLRRLVEHVLDGGVHGVSPVGSTGEGAHLSPQQRVDVTARVRQLVPEGLAVVAGAPVLDPTEGLRHLDDLAAAGADAALVSLQGVYPLADADVARVYETLAERSSLPIVLYNIPVYTRIRLAPSLVGRLAQHPNVLGIKDSSFDVEYLQEVVCATSREDFRVLTGAGTLLVASLGLGAHGMIAASMNLVPELGVGIHRAFTSGEEATARALQERLSKVITACRRDPAPAGWKAALSVAGICSDAMVAPASPLPEPAHSELARALTDLGVVGGGG